MSFKRHLKWSHDHYFFTLLAVFSEVIFSACSRPADHTSIQLSSRSACRVFLPLGAKHNWSLSTFVHLDLDRLTFSLCTKWGHGNPPVVALFLSSLYSEPHLCTLIEHFTCQPSDDALTWLPNTHHSLPECLMSDHNRINLLWSKLSYLQKKKNKAVVCHAATLELQLVSETTAQLFWHFTIFEMWGCIVWQTSETFFFFTQNIGLPQMTPRKVLHFGGESLYTSCSSVGNHFLTLGFTRRVPRNVQKFLKERPAPRNGV